MIIVTGGSGFIGSNIIKGLNNDNITDILVVDNLKFSNKFTNLVDLNISDYIDKHYFLNKIISEKKLGNIDAIFHIGACSSTIENDGNYIMNNNYQYSKELLHYALKYKIPFLYASSASIYGNNIDHEKSNKSKKPLNIYAYSKFLFDKYVSKILPKSYSQVVGFRYFNVYGPRESHKGNMASIIFQLYTQFHNNEKLKLFKGSENFKRDFIYIDDVVSTSIWFMKKGISGIFDLGSGRSETFQKVAIDILSYYNKQDEIEYIPFPQQLINRYQTFTQANLSKLHNVGYNKSFETITSGIFKYLNLLNHDF